MGRRGENEARTIEFDCSPFAIEFPSGVPVVLLKRPGDSDPYPVPVDVDGAVATWTVRAVDVEKAGIALVEIDWVDGGKVAKSATMRGIILNALGTPSTPPDPPIKGWMEKVLDAASVILSHIGDAMDAAASALASAASATASAQSAQASEKAAEISAVNSADSAEKSREWAEESAGAAASALDSATSAEATKTDIMNAVDPTLSIPGAPADAAATGAELAKKATNPTNPVVGQWGRVKDIGADGQPVWETAELPIADASSAGIVRKVTGTYGVGMSNAAGLYITTTPKVVIPNRNTNFYVNQAVTLNAVDACVTASMCDGKGPAWTPDERKAARERMGIHTMTQEAFDLLPLDQRGGIIIISEEETT